MDLISKIKNDQIEIFQKSLLTGVIKEHSEVIYCDSLKDFMNIDVRNSTDHKVLFNNLKSMKGPVLYWFEILSENTHEEIRQKLIEYKNTSGVRASSAMWSYTVPNSKYLYVGKVKKGISGRMVTHLGYNKNPDTSGLQLFHWSKGMNLTLKLSVMEFIPEMADLMGVIELKVAQNLHPIIGKH
ncbi:hypothetical protein H9Y05_07830 [Crocinitomicaceae bacterium CZZ-1]|uniref:Uncharacterized protein n=1 Tax=Taishania pollutisoli TaxID=2766479 RepID=A0A8J6PIR4_9FLAO|nr:hypothetical protein [Taishania pollutisoli]MBC9812381.1 hypothetical protein [Taishania pollutisoli]